MSWWHYIVFLLRNLNRRRADRELDEEIRIHMEMETELNLNDGLSPDEAHFAAMRTFGGEMLAKERSRAMWGFRTLENLLQDLRYSLRAIRKNPSFSLVVVLTLALGIGANTIIFSVVDAILLRPLPYASPDRLTEIWRESGDGRSANPYWELEAFKEWRNQKQIFEAVEGYAIQSYTLTGDFDPETPAAAAVSTGLFSFLGIQPQIGRPFLTADAEAGNNRVVILGDELWRQRFGASKDILGKSITLNDKQYTVLGVMPAGFAYPRRIFKLWVPLVEKTTTDAERNVGVQVIGRLRPGLPLASAQMEIKSVTEPLNKEKRSIPGWVPGVNRLDEHRVNPGPRRAIMILFYAVGFVLLIACVNATNLFLARAAAREREISIRTALGAGRLRLIQQLLTESTVLSLAGGACGTLLAYLGVRAIVNLTPKQLTFLLSNEITIEKRVLLFTLGISCVTGIAVGLIPALRISLADLKQSLNNLTHSSMMGRGHNRLRHTLVVIEIALSFVLLIGAGLMIRSFVRLTHEPLGFDPNNLLTFKFSLPPQHYPTIADQVDFFNQLKARTAGLPGVESITVATGIPPNGGGFSFRVEIEPEGKPQVKLGDTEFLPFNNVDANYFQVMHIPLVMGRTFSEQDTPTSPQVIVINDVMARRLWPGEDPSGKRLRFGSDRPWLTVVGVAGDVKAMGPDDANGSMEYYYSSNQDKTPGGQKVMVVRSTSATAPLIAAVRSQVRAMDRSLPIGLVATGKQLTDESMAEPRFYLMLMSLFAGSAILLAGIGIYGVMSYSVTQRRQEIGVRIAMGARPVDILKQILGRGMVVTSVGIAIGVAAAIGLTRMISSMLFGVSATDPLTFVAIAILLSGIAILTCYLPARRASKVDPMVALRWE